MYYLVQLQDLTREMAKEWQTVSAEERKICDDIAAQNKADYEEAMKLYQAQLCAVHAGVADGGEEVRGFPRGFLRRGCLPMMLTSARRPTCKLRLRVAIKRDGPHAAPLYCTHITIRCDGPRSEGGLPRPAVRRTITGIPQRPVPAHCVHLDSSAWSAPRVSTWR